MEDRLAPLCLLPPPANTPWSGHECELQPKSIHRIDGIEVPLELPLFWYDPPWGSLSYQQADWLAAAVAEQNVVVSALRRDLSDEETPILHSPQQEESDEEPETPLDRETYYLPRMVPYRPERYGLLRDDFDNARVIDVRLTVHRDHSGRFAYSPDQIQRWEATPDDAPHAGGGYVPAGTFPPDVVSLKQLGRKLDQLRALSPGAAVFVSIPPFRLEEELSGVLAARPDGIILRMDRTELEPLQLAALTRRARRLMKVGDAGKLPLWVVPGPITPDDAAKLVALGAAGVAIDHWCAPLVEEVLESGGGSPYSTFGYSNVAQMAEYALTNPIDRFAGLRASLDRIPSRERLGTFSTTWAKTLKIAPLR